MPQATLQYHWRLEKDSPRATLVLVSNAMGELVTKQLGTKYPTGNKGIARQGRMIEGQEEPCQKIPGQDTSQISKEQVGRS
jgi:hypothetical protein